MIPENIIVRPPSAELKPDQTDQDSLPPYDVLDAIVHAYMEEDRSPRHHRRRPAAPCAASYACCVSRNTSGTGAGGIRITPRGFGKDWRYPITNRYRDKF